MLEKLLENWLDSASEKSYQPSFVQMLVAQDYSVLHSTRHCALEYGKDVIAIAPDGTPCAFQLKGNPGSRLGLNEFRSDLQPQLIQLMSQPIIFPGITEAITHRSYLVSNGYFEEEVQRAVDDLNRGPYLSKLSLIGRGQLLRWGKKLGINCWPSEMANIRELLELFLIDGKDLFPVNRLASVLEQLLSLRISDEPLKSAELDRATTSSALLTGIALHNFVEEDNNFAIASAWCHFVVSTIISFQRSNLSISKKSKESILLAEQTIKDALISLWDEIQERKYLVEGNPFSEPEVYRWRYTLLTGLLCVLWFFPIGDSNDEKRRDAIVKWLDKSHDLLLLWGESATPCFIALQFFLRSSGASALNADNELVRLFNALISRNQPGNLNALADPYYSYEDIVRAIYGLKASDNSSALKEESFSGSAYNAELLLHLMARYNLKQPCKDSWLFFNRMFHKRFLPSEAWQYGLLKCGEGVEETKQYPSEYTWEQLCKDSSIESCEYLPKELSERPHLLLLWLFIAPHRLTSDVGRVLDKKLNKYSNNSVDR